MSDIAQVKRAQKFLELHHDPKLLILPNIWDAMGARLLQHLGFPAVATASAAVAYSLGYDDGEKITFDEMLGTIRRVASSVDVPVTADIERGYADTPADLARNVRDVIRAGAIGLNIEDSFEEGGELRSIDDQCKRLATVREAADAEGVPLVINARTDVFLSNVSAPQSAKLEQVIARATAYLDAGGDCVYPILVGDIETLSAIRAAIDAPINVYASLKTAPMRELEAAGVSRLSLGPGLIKAAMSTMKGVAKNLQGYGSYDSFTNGVITNDEILEFVDRDKMSGS